MCGMEQSYVSKMSVSKMVFDQKERKSAIIVWFFDSFQGKRFKAEIFPEFLNQC
jgi:hypothetical protein